jgi:hypothetical protein
MAVSFIIKLITYVTYIAEGIGMGREIEAWSLCNGKPHHLNSLLKINIHRVLNNTANGVIFLVRSQI